MLTGLISLQFFLNSWECKEILNLLVFPIPNLMDSIVVVSNLSIIFFSADSVIILLIEIIQLMTNFKYKFDKKKERFGKIMEEVLGHCVTTL